MDESLVVTLIGKDRPGIVAKLADVAAAHDAGWRESKMARLAGHFAGIVHLDPPPEGVAALEAALKRLEFEGLSLAIERGTSTAEATTHRIISLEIIGQDRNGIVRDISAVLAQHRVSIDELDTGVESASMSGEALFRAVASLRLRDDEQLEALRADLEAIADELMVELRVDTQPARPT